MVVVDFDVVVVVVDDVVDVGVDVDVVAVIVDDAVVEDCSS